MVFKFRINYEYNHYEFRIGQYYISPNKFLQPPIVNLLHVVT